MTLEFLRRGKTRENVKMWPYLMIEYGLFADGLLNAQWDQLNSYSWRGENSPLLNSAPVVIRAGAQPSMASFRILFPR